ncbi:MAG: NYN domain-containing protein [Dechloromonas sp.]|nr:NYN domain-containing protein [Dechloromonas sp.]
MALPRAILFVDGENLTMRYQAMLRDGARPREAILHRPDTYVWREQLTRSRFRSLEKIVRTYYYTSAAGDEDLVNTVRAELARIRYSSRGDDGGMSGQIVPIVFKKSAQDRKTRKVDIRIAIDVMRFAFTDEVERVYLASGDGDYLPLIDEVMRRGKQVEILSFSSGLSEALPRSVDMFHDLDDVFFLGHDE